MQSETVDKKNNNPWPSSSYRHGRHSNLASTHSDAADLLENVCLFFCFKKERRAVIINNNNNNRRYSIQSPYWSQTWSNGFSVEEVAPAWLVCGLTSSLKYCMERRGGRSSPSSSLPPLPNQPPPAPRPTVLSSPTNTVCSKGNKKRKHHISQ